MNLIERLWKFVKKQCLYAKYYPDFHSFTTAIERCLQDTHTIHAKALQSLLTLNFQTFQKIQSLPRTVYSARGLLPTLFVSRWIISTLFLAGMI
ncbi:hypothetical protein ACCUM_0151 [Candidatus Accumulibacter phosphatis]|uniref:Mobile element protein n=1 Tax=Candidatus Accumulibacter phosphatis TaxID=327160 RepID=A0A5S4EL95_9PROT|nr:hypothetical protein ACCUM_0151 [Candidatus Accumulibacter phosphatis]